MGHYVLAGEPPIEIRLKRHARARRLSLRVARSGGAVTLTMPQRARRAAALDFVHRKEGWIRAQLAACQPERPVAIGEMLPFRGTPVPLVAGAGRAVRFEDGCLHVPGPPDRIAPRLGGFLKAAARAELAPACDRHALALGVGFARLSLRDTRSRWGSCTQEGRLMFSWRLIMAPPEVLDYVAAHEVAHLREMNHSRAFWRLVETLCPDYRRLRSWLRENGAALQSYRFRD